MSTDEDQVQPLREEPPTKDISLVWYGFGSVIVPLAAVIGLTIIGASAAAGYW